MPATSPEIILLDNGSVKVAATLQLRKLADNLQTAVGRKVNPVSLRHADRIDAAQLAGQPAQTLVTFLAQQLAKGQRKFILLPLFFAKSGALTKYLPNLLETLREQQGDFDLELADVVYPLPQGEPAMLQLFWQPLKQMLAQASAQAHIVLVDHGSPDPQVTAVRQHLAQQLRAQSGLINPLDEAVMERRDGAQYDFNGELLETVLRRKAQQGVTEILLLMQFFLPGRHAGEGGDIEQICHRIESEFEGLKIVVSPLVAQNPLLIPVLQARLKQAEASFHLPD